MADDMTARSIQLLKRMQKHLEAETKALGFGDDRRSKMGVVLTLASLLGWFSDPNRGGARLCPRNTIERTASILVAGLGCSCTCEREEHERTTSPGGSA